MIYGLTTLGVIHTLISLVAVVCGYWAMARDRQVVPGNALGRTYLVSTALTAITGLFIFQHGGFGPPHVLSILTLLALAVGCTAAYGGVFGRWSRYVQAAAFTTTLFFHMVPGVTETLTRLPLSKPLLPNAEAPELKAITGVLLLIYLAGLALQLRWLRGQPAALLAAEPAA